MGLMTMPELLIQLDKPPRENYGFLWADYVELRCITSQDGMYGEGHIVDLNTESGELHQDDELDDHDIPDEESGRLFFDQAVERKWADASRRLKSRQVTMHDYWPFKFHNGVLHRKFDTENKRHQIYVALLIASALRYCKRTRHDEITSSLEEIGYQLFTALMPSGWNVRIFGANKSFAPGYDGNLAEKLQALAKDIYPRYCAPPENFDPKDRGDGGLDLIAWHPLGDSARGHLPVVFAQCGCSPTDWEHKQLEASPLNMDSKITPHHPAANFYIMPHDLKAPGDGWERMHKVNSVVMIDRYRIIKLVEQYDLYQQLPTWGFVTEASGLRLEA